MNRGLYFFYVHDHLHSPVALVYINGNVMERYEYDVYGNPYILEPKFADDPDGKSDYGNPYLFTGRRVDLLDNGNLTLQINRHRYYDYYTGRWLTQDPLGMVEGTNLYEYSGSHPVYGTDPFGLHHDFNPDGPTPPSIPAGAIVWDISSWPSHSMHLWLYNFYGRLNYWTWPDGTSAEYCIIGGDFLLDVMGQSQLVTYENAIERLLEIDAKYMLSELDCGGSDTFADRGSSIILADLTSTNVRLSLQTFSVWWEANCVIGPRRCCAPSDTCGDGYGSDAFWHCSISWTLYDYYDFASWNPLGWVGHPFHIMGFWQQAYGGTARICKNCKGE